MNLSINQQKTFNEMINAPVYDYANHQWCDCFKRDDGIINGNWNTLTLKALARKGFIEIVKIGDFWNDMVRVL